MAPAVVRVVTEAETEKSYTGTGFLIAPNTILTNHHVLYDHEDNVRRMRRVSVWFDYEFDKNGQLRRPEVYECDVETIDGEFSHDWAIVRTRKAVSSAYPIMNLQPKKPVEVHDYVYIIQHPEGRPKVIALHHNNVEFVDADRVQYKTDTLQGSSGSPVCNEFWEVIALHRQWDEELVGGEKKYKNEIFKGF